jgi:hypothetical protein
MVLAEEGGDDVVHLCCVPVVQLRYIVELGCFNADAGQREMSLSLGEPYVWPLGPERR